MPVSSSSLGLSGQCDVVEFHQNGRVIPVEYKRGMPKAHRADEVQLCAQSIALEEMRGMPAGAIREGWLYYGKNRRRSAVTVDDELRSLTRETALSLHKMIACQTTPPPSYTKEKCDACSLIEICNPHSCGLSQSTRRWFESMLAQESP
jgi:CRISPR-associated exonuclease Cas4